MRITSLVVVVVAATGCGQLEFEDEPAVQINSKSSSLTGVCAQTRTTVGPVLTTGELAATQIETWSMRVLSAATLAELFAN